MPNLFRHFMCVLYNKQANLSCGILKQVQDDKFIKQKGSSSQNCSLFVL
jgi:hypothetical protein